MTDGSESASRAALVVLVLLAVAAPWPFGSAHPLLARGIAIVALLVSLTALAFPSRHFGLPRRLLVLFLGLWLLGVVQLIPLPQALHRLLAPGSATVWYPADPVAAAVLGGGTHPLSLDPQATARWLAFASGLVAITLLSAPGLRRRRVALVAAVAIVAGAVVVAVYGVVARLAFGNKLYGVLAVPTVAPFGPFVSKNHFAGYVEMAACLAIGLASGLADEARRGPEPLSWLEGRRGSRAVFAWGAAAVLVLAVPVSLSRGGVVSLAAGLAAFAALRARMHRSQQKRRARLILPLAGLAAAAIGVALVLPSEATDRVQTLADASTDLSGSYRIGLWKDSLRLAAANPLFGSGLGAYQDAIPRFKSDAAKLRIEHAENDYLELLVEGGLTGVVLLGLLAFGASALLRERLRDEPHRLTRALRAGALAGVVALLVHSAFDFNLRIPSNALLFAVLAALALAPNEPANGEEPDAGTVPVRARLVGGAMLTASLVLAIATPWTGRSLDRTRFEKITQGDATSLRWRALEQDAIAQIRRRPADATAWVALAWLRRPRSPTEASALATWGVSLDPQWAALRRVADRITAASHAPRTR
jgi:O-antigen ligase